MDEHIKKADAVAAVAGSEMTEDERIMLCRRIGAIEAADVVPRKAYTELQAENCKLKNQVWSLKKKIKDMKSDASWDEDIRRGQVQGMW